MRRGFKKMIEIRPGRNKSGMQDNLEASSINPDRCLVSEMQQEPPLVEVVIEIPRGSFIKRGSTGKVDFISPLPCPFNYGSLPDYLGLDGDLLDALVLGPRLPAGTRVRAKAWGAIRMVDHGMLDDKLICSDLPPDILQRQKVLRFFQFYAKCKGLLNVARGRLGRNACEGWRDAAQAIARARPCGSSPRLPPPR
ncbi:MAG: Inorganic pyrophosphatase [Nitrosospira multiformis]|jgi:inorganic pyrophosphatase|nr:Inorganic pyrophosphatase [Nitrosospira multiformis]